LQFKQDGSFKIIQATDFHVRSPAQVPITRDFLYNLVVMDRAGKDPAFNIWLFDSGSHIEPGYDNSFGCVQWPQIDWFDNTNEALGYLPSIAFQHIVRFFEKKE